MHQNFRLVHNSGFWRASALLALLSVAGCQCDVPSASLQVGLADVHVDHDAITIKRGDDVVWRTAASDISSKVGDALYVMQFGMFDLQDDEAPWTSGATFRIVEADDRHITVAVHDDADAAAPPLATLTLAAEKQALQLHVTATDARANRLLLKTPCAPTDHFIGFGAQTHDVDHRGQIVPLWVSEQGIGKVDDDTLPTLWQVMGRRHTTHVPMPAFVRSDGVAVAAATHAFSRFDVCATNEDTLSIEAWTHDLSLLLFTASSVKDAQQALVRFSGRPRLLPPVVFAPWNDAIFGEDNVRAFAEFLRAQAIPSSVIWTEDWRGGRGEPLYRLDEDWRLDRAIYPNYEDLLADLRALGFDQHVYFNTFVTQGSDVFDEVTQAGFAIANSDGSTHLFPGADRDFSPTTLLDLTNGDAKQYMLREHLKPALDLGVRGWMADFAEWMPVQEVTTDALLSLADGSDPRVTHNRYPVLWQALNRDALTQADRLDDSVVMGRSGAWGSPPLVDVLWAGDQRTSFAADDGLATVMPIGIGTATVGFDYFAHDIGGYQSSTNDPATEELFFRWTTLGAFTPVMRTHHGTHARSNYNLTSTPAATAHFKRYAEIHIRLYPYLRALALANHDDTNSLATGAGPLPLWVPLPLLFDDEAVWQLKDEVMLGPNLLVAPVVTEGQTQRDVFIPTGRFVAMPMPGAAAGTLGASRDVFVGPATVSVDVPMSEIPIFVRAGGIVPFTREPAQTLLRHDTLKDLTSTTGDREVVVALGAGGRFQEEDGSTITLTGNGTALPDDADAEGVVTVVGNATVVGEGFTLTLTNQPTTRQTRLVLR